MSAYAHLFDDALRHFKKRHLETAENLCLRILALTPHEPNASHLLGLIFFHFGKTDRAVELLHEVLLLMPESAAIHVDLAIIFQQLGRFQEGVEESRKALSLQPNLARASCILGIAYAALGQYSEAVVSLQEAIRCQPDLVDAHVNLGYVFKVTGDIEAAIGSCREALRLQPGAVAAHNNLAATFSDRGLIEEAIASYRKALQYQPMFPAAHSNLLFSLNHSDQHSPEAIFAEHRRWAELYEAQATPPLTYANERSPQRVLRIGYVSADLRRHAVVSFLEPILAAHDPRQVQLFAYANVALPDAVTQRLKSYFHVWRETFKLSDAQLVQQIQSDGIDVLVDLTGHTGNNRLLVFAHKPAPIQVTYLGYPNTTGLRSMDYRLTDAIVDPPGAEAVNSEKLVRLPRGMVCYTAPAEAPAVTPLPARRNGRITFGSLHKLAKLNAKVLDVWCRILLAVPTARMLVFRDSLVGSVKEDLLQQFLCRGVEKERIELRHEVEGGRGHLAVYGDIDIALDTFPYAGGTTSCESLWMGVPFPTLRGDRSVARVGESLLHTVGLSELIADTPEQYGAIAVRLAGDWERLSQCRLTMRDRVRTTLGDAKAFTRDLEKAYRTMWQDWCDQSRQEPVLAPDADLMGLAFQCHEQGQLQKAESLYMQVLRSTPDEPDALHLLGVIALQKGRLDQAKEFICKAIAIVPDCAAYHGNLGSAYHQLGQHDKAIAECHLALRLQPNLANASLTLGKAWVSLGRLDDAANAYKAGLKVMPNDAHLHNGLGFVFQRQELLQDAVDCFTEAIRHQPTLAESHNALGTIAYSRGELDKAIGHYRQAIGIRPHYAVAHNNLGTALASQGLLKEASECYQVALQCRPQFPVPHFNLGNTFSGRGLVEEAITSYRKALQYQSKYPAAHGNLLFSLNFSDQHSPEAIFAEHRRWAELYEAQATPPLTYANERSPQRVLRIGYVSADLRRHAVVSFLEPILAAHDPRQVQLFAYANVALPDAVTQRLKSYFHVWRETFKLSDAQLVQQIQSDGIDVLVDLTGHTGNNRLLVFAHKPAPIQVTYLGYPNTTGLRSMDYRLTDAIVDPPGAEAVNSEKLVRLPRGMVCYTAPAEAPAVTPLPARRNGRITFGSLHKLAKLNAKVLDVWCRILLAVPTARMLVFRDSLVGSVKEDLLQQFLCRGVEKERIELRHEVEGGRGHLAVYGDIDIALDTFPYAGGTTSCESLWMGVPFPTLRGDRSVARVGESLLHTVGLSELIADTPEQYGAIAVRLAGDWERLSQCRLTMRDRVRTTLGDAKAFTRDLEKAYRTMWQDWCDQSRQEPVLAPDADLMGLAFQCHEQGQLQKAESLYMQVLRSTPDEPDALHLLGVIALQKGRLDQAKEFICKAIAIVPDCAAYHGNLGSAYHQLGQHDKAVAECHLALRLQPNLVKVSRTLGAAFAALGNSDGAISAYRNGLVIQQDDALLHHGLGLCFDNQGRSIEAEASFSEAIRYQPTLAESHNNRGNALNSMGQFDKALECFRRALEIRPNYAIAHNNLGNALAARGLLDDGIPCYYQALRFQVLFPIAHSNLLFSLNHSDQHSPEAIFAEHRRWAELYEAQATPPLTYANERSPQRVLRIGYVSADLRRHAVVSFLEPILAAHDPRQVQLFAYANVALPDAVTQRLKSYFHVWRETFKLSDAQLVQQIQSDGIDVLVDLTGHTGNNRLLVFAHKPAPIQVTYLGYPNTTGLRSMDYRLTDAIVDPPGAEAVNSEKLVRLPRGMVCYTAPAEAPAVTPLPARRNGRITFGSLHKLAKLNAKVLDVWCRILLAVPTARMLVFRDSLVGSVKEDLLQQFLCRGVEKERIELRHEVEGGRGHLAVYGDIDIALDTFPYAGGTTSCESLWMGVPFPTLRGDRSVARVGESLLHTVGLSELIADTPEQYGAIAVRLAGDWERLSQCRLTMRDRVRTTLGDAKAFTRDLEKAYRTMWQDWCTRYCSTEPT